MILDAEGIANLACLKFDDYEETKGKIGKSAQHEVQAESQTVVLFQNQGEEIFAINLSMVSRLEKITSSQITNIGDKIFFKHAGNAIRLIQLDDFLPVAKMTSLPDKMYVIIPQLLKNPIGIICSKIVDVLERPILFTSNVLPCRGLLGSCIINEKLTLFLDIHQLVNIINPPEPQNEPFFKNKKVLVVEDTPFYSLTTSRFLTDFQVNFEVVNNGAQALERINSDHYDLILTDIEMPEMDGLELCRKIRSSPPIKNMPVVALVSSITHSFLERSKEVGLDGYELKLDKEGVRNMLNHFFIQQPVHNYPSVR
ncbi:MAG: hypothetical protein A2007_04835 [Verrucomicrobia bacterium GWC2_42_7]|nr:MAG: hypothetical protein A2007_04835 [Verrucomicrobia bacterium GWC2_42_7]